MVGREERIEVYGCVAKRGATNGGEMWVDGVRNVNVNGTVAICGK